MRHSRLFAQKSIALVAVTMVLAACEHEEVAIAPPHMLAVTIGDTHSCSISEAGHAYCWGNGEEGQLGTGKFERINFARRLPDRKRRSVVVGCGLLDLHHHGAGELDDFVAGGIEGFGKNAEETPAGP